MKKLTLALVLTLLLTATSAFAGKMWDASVPTAALTKIATATHLNLCSAQPANYAGIAAVSLANKTLTAGVGGASFGSVVTGNAGAGSYRINLLAINGVTPTANGTITYECFDDGALLLSCTTVTSQAVTTSQSWNIPQHGVEIGIPQ